MMIRHHISTIIQILIISLLQVLIFNHLRLFSYCIPIIYLYPIFKMPIHSDRWVVILLATFAGFVMDMFMNTPGLNMSVAAIVGLLRSPLLHLLISEEDEPEDKDAQPSFRSMNGWLFLIYIIVLPSIHITLLLLIEAFSLRLFSMMIPYILGAISVTIPLFLIVEAFRSNKKKKRA